jgi:hypothetical protein
MVIRSIYGIADGNTDSEQHVLLLGIIDLEPSVVYLDQMLEALQWTELQYAGRERK